MTADDRWITDRLEDARASQPLVTDRVVAQMRTMLNDKLGRRPLTTTELGNVARELISKMALETPKAEVEE